MHQNTNNNHLAATLATTIALLACVTLAACGSSSRSAKVTSHTTSVAAASVPSTTVSSAAAQGASQPHNAQSGPLTATDQRRRRTALRVIACMHRYGIALPQPGPNGYIALHGPTAGSHRFKTATAKCRSLLSKL